MLLAATYQPNMLHTKIPFVKRFYPSLKVGDFFSRLKGKYSTSDTSVRKDNPGYHFLIDALQGIVAEHALTLQGYEYLKNPDR